MTITSSDPFVEFVKRNHERLERALSDFLPRGRIVGTEHFNNALEYAVFPGGKRLRAYLTLIAARFGGRSEEQSVALACAMEFVHTSSLIFDDLPSMDDADLRRHKPALHLAFGESTAIRVAVGLLNQAYSLFAQSVAATASAERLQQLLTEVSECIGCRGMISGQAVDLALRNLGNTEDASAGRNLKTSGLMRLTMTAGAIASGQTESEIAALAAFGDGFGCAYQIYDDIVDLRGSHLFSGKTVGQDNRHAGAVPTNSSLSYAAVPEALERAAATIVSAKAALDPYKDRPETGLLQAAADSIVRGFTSLVEGISGS